MTEDTVAQSASSHAASLVQKLAARQAQICSEREERQQQLQSEADPREDVTRFLSNWSAERDRLQVQCSTLQQQAAAPLAEAAKHSLLQQLEDVSSSISKREQATADAAYFLPPYELRSCTAHLQELRAQAAAVKQQLQPKRKFAFSKAVCRKPAADVAALTAAIVGTDLKQHVTRTADQSAVATAAAAAGTAAGQSAVPAVQPVVPPPSLQDLQLIASGQGLTGLRGKTVTKTTDQLTAGQAFVLHDLQVGRYMCNSPTIASAWSLGPLFLLHLCTQSCHRKGEKQVDHCTWLELGWQFVIADTFDFEVLLPFCVHAAELPVNFTLHATSCRTARCFCWGGYLRCGCSSCSVAACMPGLWLGPPSLMEPATAL